MEEGKTYIVTLEEVDYNMLLACTQVMPSVRDFLANKGQAQVAHLFQDLFNVLTKIPAQSEIKELKKVKTS
tara:strand:+ start:597 stop:809 length:213 start_codon:yes stop_codon:yes gene_type:complete